MRDLREGRELGDAATGAVLMPSRLISPLRSLWVRVAIAVACLLLTALVVWLDRDGYRDLDGTLDDFMSCLYYATVTLSTTGYGDITPVTTAARMINVMVITPLRFIFLITLIGTTVEVLTSRGREEYRRNRWRKRVHDHTIIVGFGVKGRTAAQTLLESGTSASDIVVVASDDLSCEEAGRMGMVAVRGDARREEVLQAAGIESARALIVAADSDDVTVLITLTARRLNPALTVTVAARESQNAPLLRQSGASRVIMTAESAGRLLAITLTSPTAGAVLEDLIDPTLGLEVLERPVLPAELGLAPGKLSAQGDLVLSVIRDGVSHRFDAGEIDVLQRGDRLVLIHYRNGETGTI